MTINIEEFKSCRITIYKYKVTDQNCGLLYDRVGAFWATVKKKSKAQGSGTINSVNLLSSLEKEIINTIALMEYSAKKEKRKKKRNSPARRKYGMESMIC